MIQDSGATRRGLSFWRDLLISGAIAALGAAIAAQVDLHERLFAYSRRWESIQLDELPVAIFVFALCMVLMYARRVRELQRVLHANRQLAQRTLDVQEDERKHLARELHDELGQYVNAIKLDSLSLTEHRHGEIVGAAAGRITRNADHVYGVVGSMIHRLRPAGLDELGLVAALEACVDHWRASQPGLSIGLATSGDLDSLGERISLAIYRVVQEGLTNSVRHASARRVDIDLTRTAAGHAREAVTLTVRDDGVGASEQQLSSGGHGLTGMRERTTMLGGDFELLSGPGQGVTIRAMIPLPMSAP